MSLCKWIIKNEDENKILQFSNLWQVPVLAAKILYSRGFRKKEDVDEFLCERVAPQNPFEIPDMQKAVSRINQAVKNSEKICVFGDYDADGITSTALIYLYLKSKNANVMCFIPEREKDGYGLNKNLIKKLCAENVNVIFTVDNGVSAYNEAAYALSCGIDVVITDHHRVPEKLPPATAVVDPYRADCFMKHKNFAGVGVAFKFVEAMEYENGNFENLLKKYSDLVTLGTIGDSIDLKNETRNVVKAGLKNISNSEKPGVSVLTNCFSVKKEKLRVSDVAYSMVPKINAAGRIENSETALKMLVSSDKEAANALYEKLNEFNERRKQEETDILNAVEQLLEKEPSRKYEKIIVAEGNGWNAGVIGIVASRITKKYGKPSVIISISGEDAKGSCRSVEGFSIYELLCACCEKLERFGGHPMAAGINLKSKDIAEFRNQISNFTKNISVDCPKLCIDISLNAREIIPQILDEIKILEPFGAGNPEPVFGIFNLTLKKIRSIGQGKHLKLTFAQNGTEFEALYFNKSAADFLYYEGENLDIATNFSLNEYMGKISVCVKIIDIKLSKFNFETFLSHKKIYEKFKLENFVSSDEQSRILAPNREDFACVYRCLKLIHGKNSRADILSERIFKNQESAAKLQIIIDVMKEMGLASVCEKGDEFKLSLKSVEQKIDLNDSKILRLLNI